MKLNINSASARLYRWFYMTQSMPQSLCPYFWKLVLMWVFILPYAILSLPVLLVDSKDSISGADRISARIGIGIIWWFLIGFVVCMLSPIGLIFSSPQKDSVFMNMLMIGTLCWTCLIIFGCIELFKWAKAKWRNRHVKYDENGWRIWEPVNEKEPNIVKEFIKAKYNKYCPKIEWK